MQDLGFGVLGGLGFGDTDLMYWHEAGGACGRGRMSASSPDAGNSHRAHG